MHNSAKYVAVLSVMCVVGCGDAPGGQDVSKVTPATSEHVSPEVKFITSQIEITHKMAAKLNSIETESDAIRVKHEAAKMFIEVYGLDGGANEKFDQDGLAQALVSSGLHRDYMTAQQNLGAAMARLSSQHPASYRIVATEINKMYKASR